MATNLKTRNPKNIPRIEVRNSSWFSLGMLCHILHGRNQPSFMLYISPFLGVCSSSVVSKFISSVLIADFLPSPKTNSSPPTMVEFTIVFFPFPGGSHFQSKTHPRFHGQHWYLVLSGSWQFPSPLLEKRCLCYIPLMGLINLQKKSNHNHQKLKKTEVVPTYLTRQTLVVSYFILLHFAW